jgi:ribonuclease HII
MNKNEQLKSLREFFKNNPSQDPGKTPFFHSPHPEIRAAALKQKALWDKEMTRLNRLLNIENDLWQKGFKLVAGVDEAGRGPLAGPVAAAAVILKPSAAANPIFWGLDDSKKLSADKRLRLEKIIKAEALCWAVAWRNQTEIDRDNILNASLSAMLSALNALLPKAEYVLVDGNRVLPAALRQQAIIKGDSLSLSIAAAAVLAKCWRDEFMIKAARRFPQYGFAENKGYGSPAHIAALGEHGRCPLHRRSFTLKTCAEKSKTNSGRRAEEMAARKLEEDGFEILERNFYGAWGEIDIIARKEERIYFVEVRSKSGAGYGSPAESISGGKKEKLLKTAAQYFQIKGEELTSVFLFAWVDSRAAKVDFVIGEI